MLPTRPSRRNVLLVTAGVAAAGGLGALAATFTSREGRRLGANGFTAKTAPSGSDSVVVIDADAIPDAPLAKAAAKVLLDADAFDALPGALREPFLAASPAVTSTDRIGKLVLVGSSGDETSGTPPGGEPASRTADGGAVVWADWTDDELVSVLESETETGTRRDSYRGRTCYANGDTTGARLGDTAFALGSPDTVRRIVDVWHHDADPVGGEALETLERTPLGAPVRFSFDRLGPPHEDGGRSTTAWPSGARVVHRYGSVPAAGDSVRLRLRVEPAGKASEVAAAVQAELETASGNETAGTGEPTLSPTDVERIAVSQDHDFVTVEYRPDADGTPDPAAIDDVIATMIRVAGRSL